MLRQRDILWFWLPLFGSWLLMATEGPLLSAVINRLPNEVEMLAALGIVFSIAVTIESPIISLLSTATALAKDRRAYALLRRFTLYWMVGLTLVAAAVALTPAFDWLIVDLLGTPADIARWVEPGLIVLIPWTAAIAWRRFLQGMLIRFGRTQTVVRGTALRLVFTAGSALGLALWTDLAGIHVASAALLAGVVCEAVYASWVSHRFLAADGLPEHSDDSDELSLRGIFAFHMPLAGTSMMALLAHPLVTFALARSSSAELSLAAWPLVFQGLLVLRAPALALPEAVIALAGASKSAAQALQKFTYKLAAVGLVAMVALTMTPLAEFYLVRIQDAEAGVSRLAELGLVAFVPLPALAALIAWERGILITRHRTRLVNQAMVIHVAVMTSTLALAVAVGESGLVMAAVAMQLAMAGEWLFLRHRRRRE